MRSGEPPRVDTALLSSSGPRSQGLRSFSNSVTAGPASYVRAPEICSTFRPLKELVHQPVELAGGLVDLRQRVVLAQQGVGVDVGVVELR